MSDISVQVVESIKRFQAGDTEAFNDIYEKTYKLVYTTCYGLLRSVEDAEDITQDAFISIYQKLDTLENPETYASWMCRTATNRVIDFQRKNNRITYTDEDAELDVMASDWSEVDGLSDSFLEQEEKREIINRVLKDSLSDVQYQTLFMHYFSEMSVEDIAQAMDCPEGTVKTRLKSARCKFKDALEGYVSDNKLVLGATPFLTRFFNAQMSGSLMSNVPYNMAIPTAAVPLAQTVSTAAKAGKIAAGSSKAGGTVKAGIMSTVAGKIIISALSVAALTAVGFGTAFGIRSATHKDIDLNEYLIYKAEGYSGYAELTYSLDVNNLKADYSKLSDVSDEELRSLIKGTWSSESGIKNNDVLVYDWDVDAKEFEEDHNITFKHKDIEYKVEGLPEVTNIDPFDYVDVSVKGADHIAKAVMTKKDVPPVDLVYEFDKDRNLTNGENITLRVKAGRDDYLDKGYILTRTSNKYTVDGLTPYLTSADELPDDVVEKIKKEGIDVHRSWATLSSYIISYDYEKMIFIYDTSPKTSFNPNRCYIVYKVTTKSGISFYTYVYYYSLTTDENGAVNTRGSSFPSMVFGDNVVNGPGTNEIYEGFWTVDELYKGVTKEFINDTEREYIITERR